MPGTGTPESLSLRYAPGWHNLAWKVLVALAILLLMAAGIPISSLVVWTWVQGTLLLWGGLFVVIAAANLFDTAGGVRWAWVALAAGAYLALAAPGIIKQDPAKLVDAIGPVAALTLAAHLACRDLARALRDWALIIAIALYVALGVTAMWLVVSSFRNYDGLTVFIVAALLPPLMLEGVLLLLRRIPALRNNKWAQAGSAAFSTVPSVMLLSISQLSESTPLVAALIFALFAGLLIGGALLISLFTRPLVEAASGAHTANEAGIKLGRALVELSHGAILISLALYIPLRLLTGAVGL